MLYNKWWKRGKKAGCPKTDYDPSKASALNVVNIGGVFVVLLCGLTFAILVAIGEFCMKVKLEKSVHPATVQVMRGRQVSVNKSIKDQITHVLWLLFYGHSEDRLGGGGTVTDCSSCQSLALDGQGVRYM